MKIARILIMLASLGIMGAAVATQIIVTPVVRCAAASQPGGPSYCPACTDCCPNPGEYSCVDRDKGTGIDCGCERNGL